jgi:hypothetical protein
LHPPVVPATWGSINGRFAVQVGPDKRTVGGTDLSSTPSTTTTTTTKKKKKKPKMKVGRGNKKRNKGGEYDQSILYACIDLSQ